MKSRMLNVCLLGGILLPIFALLPLPPAPADTHYVDRSAIGSNNGSSWANAWTSFSRINWSQVTAGDTIQISGGTTSKTYNETLTVGSSGASGRPITITAGRDAGHNGKVQINGRFYLSGRSYVVVEGFSIYAAGHGGFFIQESTSIVVRNCVITTPTNTSVQTDGIFAQRNRGNIYEGNRIIISNGNSSPHCDGIQLYQETDVTVRNNYIEQRNNKTSNAQGIYATDSSGYYRVYNNVVYNPHGNNAIACRNIANSGSSNRAVPYIYNNTVVGGGNALLYLTGCPNPVIKNNIWYHTTSQVCLKIYDWSGSAANIDYNFIYTPNNSSPFYFNGASRNWSYWRTTRGFDAHGYGLTTNPLLVSGDEYCPQSGSPAINRGVSLATLFSYDRLGVSRPQSSAWDIGAYEYGGTAPVSNPPAAPRNLRISSGS